MRNGPSRGPPRRFWVKQHLISNPSIPSQAGSLFTGAGKHRNPFLVRVSRRADNKKLGHSGSCGDGCKRERKAVMNMDGVGALARRHDGAVTPWQFVGEGGRG